MARRPRTLITPEHDAHAPEPTQGARSTTRKTPSSRAPRPPKNREMLPSMTTSRLLKPPTQSYRRNQSNMAVPSFAERRWMAQGYLPPGQRPDDVLCCPHGARLTCPIRPRRLSGDTELRWTETSRGRMTRLLICRIRMSFFSRKPHLLSLHPASPILLCALTKRDRGVHPLPRVPPPIPPRAKKKKKAKSPPSHPPHRQSPPATLFSPALATNPVGAKPGCSGRKGRSPIPSPRGCGERPAAQLEVCFRALSRGAGAERMEGGEAPLRMDARRASRRVLWRRKGDQGSRLGQELAKSFLVCLTIAINETLRVITMERREYWQIWVRSRVGWHKVSRRFAMVWGSIGIAS
ncbi:hypothetical protein EJ04DRAFT_307851 [Polyplosphaeria fusca]|uniref:Uncharacterized protein n=1 Tax=Polyplosphaeria fusca TaxID=682080 RepID=A0A9P4QWV4_9PLEO|nr:hypothetical protein EJ04DRAFT_307851 [Polyplosphaeria fusca]